MAASTKKIKITKTDEDGDTFEYEIMYQDKKILINCIKEIKEETLYLKKVDVEGAGANVFGKRIHTVIKEISKEFCKMYNCKRIEISGAKRTAGRTKGSVLRTLKHQFDEIE